MDNSTHCANCGQLLDHTVQYQSKPGGIGYVRVHSTCPPPPAPEPPVVIAVEPPAPEPSPITAPLPEVSASAGELRIGDAPDS